MKSLIRPAVMVVTLVVIIFGTTGCVTYQRNDVVKQNHIIKKTDGTVVDNSTYTDRSKSFALAGIPGTRRYASQIAVGTENSNTPVVGSTYYWQSQPTVGQGGATYYGSYPNQVSSLPGAVYVNPGPSVYTRYPDQLSPLPGAVYGYGGGHHVWR